MITTSFDLEPIDHEGTLRDLGQLFEARLLTWRPLFESHTADPGNEAAAEANERCLGELNSLATIIAAMSTTSSAGLLVKARCAQWLTGHHPAWFHALHPASADAELDLPGWLGMVASIENMAAAEVGRVTEPRDIV